MNIGAAGNMLGSITRGLSRASSTVTHSVVSAPRPVKLLGVAAAALGAAMVLASCATPEEKAANEAERLANREGPGGNPVSDAVAQLFERHDHDGSGTIDLGGSNVPEWDERITVETRSTSRTDRDWNILGDDFGKTEGTSTKTQQRYNSMAEHLQRMDADGNERVTQDEATTWIADGFDDTGEGNLNELEHEAYEEFTAPRTSEWRTVDSDYRSHGNFLEDLLLD